MSHLTHMTHLTHLTYMTHMTQHDPYDPCEGYFSRREPLLLRYFMTSVVGFYTEDKPFVESYSPRRSQRTLSKLWIRSRLNLRRRPKKISKAPSMFCEESFGKILKMREMSSFSGRTGRSTNSIDWNESCDKHAVYFRRWLKWRAMFIAFWLFGKDVISLEWMSLISCI